MPSRGFTLTEVILVIFLIGVASASVVQTFIVRSDLPAKKAAQSFMALFAHYKDKALIQGQTTGVLINHSDYQFMQRRQGEWRNVPPTRVSAKKDVPKQVQMRLKTGSDIWQDEYTLELHRRRLMLQDIELELEKLARKKTPQIRYSPFEAITPFSLRFYHAAGNECWEVVWRVEGELSLEICDWSKP